MPLPLLIGIDIGGTFTDFVVYYPDNQRLETFKRLSTPADPAQAVLDGLNDLFTRCQPEKVQIIHGSTVATNALLERKGARIAFVATRGFADILQIGRQNRPSLYDWSVAPPEPLAPPELRFEVDERISAEGQVLQALDPTQVEGLAIQIKASGAEAVAVCLLFSFLQPAHECTLTEALRSAGLNVSASHEVLPEFREYERASATAVNAYVTPALDRYLGRLEQGLVLAAEHIAANPASASEKQIPLRIMQSNGGAISVSEARQSGVRCILSGPAGGVIGAQAVLSALTQPAQETTGRLAKDAHPLTDSPSSIRAITFDMGGTSTDVSLIDGAPQVTYDAMVGGCPVRLPLLDIHTIGAGGGSIAYVDPGGALRVGPASAGADPGPACYGRGDLPTVTDANVVLGVISPEFFLGGQMPLDVDSARRVFDRLGRSLGMNAEQAALGVVAVVNARMERALRVISIERGHDPRRFTLVSFGGAGGLHAAALRRSLGIPRLVVPPLASTLSAFGMLAADVIKDYIQTVMLSGETPYAYLKARFEPLLQRGQQDVLAEGISPDLLDLLPACDLRYAGQSYELTVPFTPDFIPDFHASHRRAYGYDRPESPIEIVNLRLQVAGRVDPPILPLLGDQSKSVNPDPTPALMGYRTLYLSTGQVQAPLYRGEALEVGNRLVGPALVARSDTTVLLGPADHADVDPFGNLVVFDPAVSPEPAHPGAYYAEISN